MTDFEQYDPAMEDQRRKTALRAHLEASAATSTAASMAAYQQVHDTVTSRQHGIFGSGDSPQEQAAAVAARRARTGDDWGNGRELQAQGGVQEWESYGSGPAPARVDLSRIDQQGREPGVSPTMAWKRGQR